MGQRDRNPSLSPTHRCHDQAPLRAQGFRPKMSGSPGLADKGKSCDCKVITIASWVSPCSGENLGAPRPFAFRGWKANGRTHRLEGGGTPLVEFCGAGFPPHPHNISTAPAQPSGLSWIFRNTRSSPAYRLRLLHSPPDHLPGPAAGRSRALESCARSSPRRARWRGTSPAASILDGASEAYP